MTLVIPALPPVLLPVAGGGDYPVGRIFCIGRNYADHAREMGGDPAREAPFFFTKWAQAAVPSGTTIAYPPQTRDYQHEVELVVALAHGGRDIPEADALSHVYGYAVGLDMTRRDLQRALGDEKKPWEIGKSFDRSAPIGPIHPVEATGHFKEGAISLAVNGTVKQSSDLKNMIWSVAEQISKLSEAFELKAGDIFYSGTPENVGPVVPGDVILCKIEGLPDLSVRITPAQA